MISNILFFLVAFVLIFIGYKTHNDGDKTPFFDIALKGIIYVQCLIVVLFLMDIFIKAPHKDYIQLVDNIYRIILIACSILLWTFPVIGYFLNRFVSKFKLAYKEE